MNILVIMSSVNFLTINVKERSYWW